MSALGRTASWLVLVIVLIASVNAIVRKAFDISSNGWLEAQWILFAAILFLCAPWTLARNEHMRIDLISSRLSARTRKIIDLIGHGLFLLPLTVVMIVTSTPFVARSLQANEQSMNPGGLPQWLPKSLILLGFVLLFIQAVCEFVKRAARPAETAAGDRETGAEPASDAPIQ
jgi:TRAP-type mannitol/chloroaromatic compound transport system permease small subunit